MIGSVIGQGNRALHPTAPRVDSAAFDNASVLTDGPYDCTMGTMLDAGIGHITVVLPFRRRPVKTDIETVTHAHPEHLLVLKSGNPSHAKWNSATNDHKTTCGSVNHDLTLAGILAEVRLIRSHQARPRGL